MSFDWSTIYQPLIALGVIVGAATYLWKTIKSQASQVDNEQINRLQNMVSILEKENEYLKRENDTLKKQLENMQDQIKRSQDDIIRLKDLATNNTAINEVKTLLQKFEFVIPLMEQFQHADAQLLQEMGEVRGMIRENRKTIQRIERIVREHIGFDKTEAAAKDPDDPVTE